MDNDFIATMTLTFKLAGITTAILLFVGVALGYALAFGKSRYKPVFEALIALPLVLPPSVLGFYFLMLFSPKNPFGAWLESTFDSRLVFSFEGLVVASIIFSLPFMVHPLQNGFSAIPSSIIEAAWTLGRGKFSTLLTVMLPNMKPSILTGIVISFAHTVGEFGVVMMMGGNIRGETRVASIAIYDEVEALNYTLAHQYAFSLFAVSFAVLVVVFLINRHFLGARIHD